MADVNQIITLGIGTPSDIEHFILFGLGGESVSTPVVRTWSLFDRDTAWSLDGRDLAWSLRDRDIALSLDDRDIAWSLRDRDTTWTIEER